jgi:hypothetical protein
VGAVSVDEYVASDRYTRTVPVLVTENRQLGHSGKPGWGPTQGSAVVSKSWREGQRWAAPAIAGSQ